MKSKEYQILTSRHRDEKLFYATKIRELLSISCCHQSQHLQTSEAYNTRTYNFSTKEAKKFFRRSKMLTTSTRHGFQNTYPCIIGRILCTEERWKRQRLVEVVEYFAAYLNYFRLSHWFWRHPSGVLRAFISKCKMLSELERLDSTTNKGVPHDLQ